MQDTPVPAPAAQGVPQLGPSVLSFGPHGMTLSFVQFGRPPSPSGGNVVAATPLHFGALRPPGNPEALLASLNALFGSQGPPAAGAEATTPTRTTAAAAPEAPASSGPTAVPTDAQSPSATAPEATTPPATSRARPAAAPAPASTPVPRDATSAVAEPAAAASANELRTAPAQESPALQQPQAQNSTAQTPGSSATGLQADSGAGASGTSASTRVGGDAGDLARQLTEAFSQMSAGLGARGTTFVFNAPPPQLLGSQSGPDAAPAGAADGGETASAAPAEGAHRTPAPPSRRMEISFEAPSTQAMLRARQMIETLRGLSTAAGQRESSVHGSDPSSGPDGAAAPPASRIAAGGARSSRSDAATRSSLRRRGPAVPAAVATANQSAPPAAQQASASTTSPPRPPLPPMRFPFLPPPFAAMSGPSAGHGAQAGSAAGPPSFTAFFGPGIVPGSSTVQGPSGPAVVHAVLGTAAGANGGGDAPAPAGSPNFTPDAGGASFAAALSQMLHSMHGSGSTEAGSPGAAHADAPGVAADGRENSAADAPSPAPNGLTGLEAAASFIEQMQQMLFQMFDGQQSPANSAQLDALLDNSVCTFQGPVDGQEPEMCTICLEELAAGERGIRMPCCANGFHRGCLLKWLSRESSTCPVCRNALPEATSASSATPSAGGAPSTDEKEAEEMLLGQSAAELKRRCDERGLDCSRCLEKRELVALLLQERRNGARPGSRRPPHPPAIPTDFAAAASSAAPAFVTSFPAGNAVGSRVSRRRASTEPGGAATTGSVSVAAATSSGVATAAPREAATGAAGGSERTGLQEAGARTRQLAEDPGQPCQEQPRRKRLRTKSPAGGSAGSRPSGSGG